MPRALKILDGAKSDYQRIKSYIVSGFGTNTWSATNKEFQRAAHRICEDPTIGDFIEELDTFGLPTFRKFLVGQSWMIYEFTDAEVVVHIFIGTRQDFERHLVRRLLG